MTLWVAFGLMCVLATVFVAWPLYRHQQRMSPLVATAVFAVVALSAGLYAYQGSPDIRSGSGSTVPAPPARK